MSTDLSILSERPHIAPMPRARVFNAYLQEMRAECLRYLRNPGFMLPTLLFPTRVLPDVRRVPRAPRQ